MKKLLSVVLLTTAWLGCNSVEPGEVKATIVYFDPTYSICGASWVVELPNQQARVRDLPEGYRVPAYKVLLRYEPDVVNAQNASSCNFIKVLGIRKAD